MRYRSAGPMAWFRFCSWVAILSVFACLSLGAKTAGVPGSGGLAGAVVGPDGAGIAGAEILAAPIPEGKVFRVVSGEHGIYSLVGLPEGQFTVEVRVEGRTRYLQGPFPVRRGETRKQDFEVEVDPPGDTLEVVGEGGREVMMRQELRETGARDIAEALPKMPGLWKVRKGGIANDVVLRGFQGENLSVLIDGERVQGACPNNMDPGTFHVDIAEVDRVEVSRGPFDVKNVGSLGGTVNVVTQRPLPGVGARVSASAGSFGYQGASASASYGGEKISAQAGFSYRRSDPFRDGHGLRFTQYANYRPDQEDSEAFRVGTGWVGLFLSPDDRNHYRMTYTRQEADHVLYPYLLMDGIYDNTDRFQAGYEHQGEGTLKALRLQGYATHVSHWMTDAYRTSSTMAPRGYGMGTYARTRAFGGRLELEWPVLMAGVEATRREWDTVTQLAGMMYAPQYSIPDVDARTLGFYGLFEKTLSPTVTLKAGARYDFFGSSAEPLKANKALYLAYHGTVSTLTRENGASGNIRLLWAPKEWFDLSAGVGTTLRFPDPQELYFGLRRMGADWVGNPDLKPSRNTATELALTFRHGGNSLKVTFFRDRVENFITVYDQRRVRMVPGVMNPIAKSYANVDALLWGGEMSASAVLWGQVFLLADVAGVRGTKDPRPDLGIRSDNLAEIPPLSGRLAVRYDVGRYFAEVEGSFASAQDDVDEDLEEATTPGWGVCNLKAGVRWKGFSLTLSANNLFDRYYVEHLSYQRDPFRSGVRVPEPGRNFTVFISWRH